jgi:hypothetical protein
VVLDTSRRPWDHLAQSIDDVWRTWNAATTTWDRERKTRLPGALRHTDRGTYVVQGKLVTDPEAVADIVDLRDDEYYVEIPAELLKFARDGGA